MRNTRPSKTLSVLFALGHLIATFMAVMPAQVSAQTADLEPPAIELEAVDVGISGDNQVFSATITDNGDIASVRMFYRFSAEENYQELTLVPIAGTSIYSTSIATEGVETGRIQYYLEAQDAAGNRAIEGFAFNPLERLLSSAPVAPADGAVAATTTTEPAAERISLNRKVLYGVIGLIVVGALASASSADGGGTSSTSNTGTPGQNVPLLLVVDPPQ